MLDECKDSAVEITPFRKVDNRAENTIDESNQVSDDASKHSVSFNGDNEATISVQESPNTSPDRPVVLQLSDSTSHDDTSQRSPTRKDMMGLPRKDRFTPTPKAQFPPETPNKEPRERRGNGSNFGRRSPSDASLTSTTTISKTKPREGPSSRRTVLIIAGFFVVGLTFLTSGVIVLCTETHHAFIIVGLIFVTVGVVSLILCIFLQRKNLKKFMHDWEQDLYFLNVRETNQLLRSFFNFEYLQNAKINLLTRST